jgi:hypothetical protein
MWIESDTAPDPKTVTPDGAEDEWIIQESAGWLLSNNASTADTDNFDPSVRDPSVNGVVGNWIYLGKIGPGEDTMIIVQSFHMDSYVQNWAQTDKISFTEEILAQQTTPLADPPSPILTDEGRP